MKKLAMRTTVYMHVWVLVKLPTRPLQVAGASRSIAMNSRHLAQLAKIRYMFMKARKLPLTKRCITMRFWPILV
ncbi:hypothetical protein D3C72_1423000 [compost metagenome]